jgi:hypothetical protein
MQEQSMLLHRIIIGFCALFLTLANALHAQDTAINPLTGLPAPADNLNRRPLIVKISNDPANVRPQYGLVGADIIWEHIVAEGQTRFSAIYLGEDMPMLGPVRALSPLDFDLARIYEALVVYSQGSPQMIAAVQNDPLMSSRAFGFGDACPPFCRAPREDLDAFNNAFSENGTLALYSRAQSLGLDTQPAPVSGMTFGEAVPAGGTAVAGVEIDYGGTVIRWIYEAVDARWLRAQDNQGHFDALSGTQISADNVLLLEAPHTLVGQGDTFYWNNRELNFTVNLVGSGRVYLFRNQQFFAGEWRREDENSPLLLVDTAGQQLMLKPGKIFVNLLPDWEDGYQLAFQWVNPPSAVVTSPDADLHTGPGRAYTIRNTAYQDDALQAIGRNFSGDWIQLQAGQEILWVALEDVSLNIDLSQLPVARPQVDG